MSDIRDENQPFSEGQSVWRGLRRGQVLACAWRDEGWTALVEWQSGHITREHCDSLSASEPLVKELKGLKGETGKQTFVTGYFRPSRTADDVSIPRARYNHLLEVERNTQEFNESFTRWEA